MQDLFALRLILLIQTGSLEFLRDSVTLKLLHLAGGLFLRLRSLATVHIGATLQLPLILGLLGLFCARGLVQHHLAGVLFLR